MLEINFNENYFQINRIVFNDNKMFIKSNYIINIDNLFDMYGTLKIIKSNNVLFETIKSFKVEQIDILNNEISLVME